MTISQLITRIQELETWLIKNPTSSERVLIESDLQTLKNILTKNDE